MKIFTKLCEKCLPVYIKFWPNYWLAIWSAPHKTTALKALRITIRKGEYHSELIATIKRGTT